MQTGENVKRKTIFSGIQPTGRKHLGNYIGAIRQYVAGQESAASTDEAIYCIVDLHATTVAYDPTELRDRVHDTTAILLAAGLDPERCVLFRQGDVREHTELTWLLGAVTAWGDLNRMHQWKTKREQAEWFERTQTLADSADHHEPDPRAGGEQYAAPGDAGGDRRR